MSSNCPPNRAFVSGGVQKLKEVDSIGKKLINILTTQGKDLFEDTNFQGGNSCTKLAKEAFLFGNQNF